MRLSKPRITPVADADATPEQAEALSVFAGGPVLNIFRTLVHAPKALARFNQWGGYVLSQRNSLPPREREIVILRTGFLCRSGYEWTQHVRIALAAGVTEAEVARIKLGGDAEGWSSADAALLRAVDDLVGDHFVSEVSWAGLSHLTEKQRMDVVFTVGQYTQVSMILNSFGVQLDEGQTLDPDLKA